MFDKFKSSGFVFLLDTCLKHNLAESTSEDLVLAEFTEERSVFRLGFGFVAVEALPAALDALEAALRVAAITGAPHTTA
jgi:hypothetical protein